MRNAVARRTGFLRGFPCVTLCSPWLRLQTLYHRGHRGTRRNTTSHEIQKFVADIRTGYGTGIIPPEDAVAIAGNQFVAPRGDARMEQCHRRSQNSPACAEFLQHGRNCTISTEQALVRSIVVEHEVNGIERIRVQSVPLQNLAPKSALQCSKAKTVRSVALQNEL